MPVESFDLIVTEAIHSFTIVLTNTAWLMFNGNRMVLLWVKRFN